METALQQTVRLLQGPINRPGVSNIDVRDRRMKLYLRNTWRLLPDPVTGEVRKVHSLDIGTVEVRKFWRGRGIFTRYLREVHALKLVDVIYVECVINLRLGPHLLRIGFRVNKEGCSYYLYTSEVMRDLC